MGINSKASVPGGEVHTYGEQFVAVNSNKVIMDRDLGATKAYYAAPQADDPDVIQTIGLMYQWGRKDPLPRWSGTGVTVNQQASTQTLYDAAGTAISDNLGYNEDGSLTENIARVSAATAAGSGNALQYSIQHPTVFITTNTGLKDWYTAAESTDAAIGDAAQNDALWGDGAPKSAYDPCPQGWRVAPNGTWSDFGSDGYSDPFWYYINGEKQTAAGTPELSRHLQNGRLYEAGNVKSWYAATGHRFNYNGTLCDIGANGSIWSSSVSNTSGRFLYLLPSGLNNPNTGPRAYCFQVRCVQE